MRLPHNLTQSRLVHWNYVVRGIMEIWELAALAGWERDLERMLEADEDCRLAEALGRLGNELLHSNIHWARGASREPVHGPPASRPAAAEASGCVIAPRKRLNGLAAVGGSNSRAA